MKKPHNVCTRQTQRALQAGSLPMCVCVCMKKQDTSVMYSCVHVWPTRNKIKVCIRRVFMWACMRNTQCTHSGERCRLNAATRSSAAGRKWLCTCPQIQGQSVRKPGWSCHVFMCRPKKVSCMFMCACTQVRWLRGFQCLWSSTWMTNISWFFMHAHTQKDLPATLNMFHACVPCMFCVHAHMNTLFANYFLFVLLFFIHARAAHVPLFQFLLVHACIHE